MNSKYPPRLAITIGDPSGIGSEVILKALTHPDLQKNAEITIVGDRPLLRLAYQQLLNHVHQSAMVDPDQLSWLDMKSDPDLIAQIKVGRGTVASGTLSFAYLQTAIQRAMAGHFDGIVTAPIAKSVWKQSGYHYPGQTEALTELTQSIHSGMLFVARSPHTHWTLRVLLATTHIPLAQVSGALSAELMTNQLRLLIDSLHQDFAINSPRIAIAGLNPHSGELGQLGSEEQEWIIPWLIDSRERYPNCQLDGPVPPDTLWIQPGYHWYGHPTSSTPYDAYLALYHDQGLIPVKLLAFDQAVNTTIGLPIIRTSPDHGTAFDITGQGIAQPHSMVAAIRLAIELSHNRFHAVY